MNLLIIVGLNFRFFKLPLASAIGIKAIDLIGFSQIIFILAKANAVKFHNPMAKANGRRETFLIAYNFKSVRYPQHVNRD